MILSSFAILLRILVATRREGIEIDGITYLQNARAMTQDWGAIDILHPPLYSLVLAPFLGLWSDPEWGARVISSVLGGLWVWPTLLLARETTNEKVAWSSGLLVACLPAAVEGSTRVLSEALYGLFLTGFLFFFIRTLKEWSVGLAGLTGILGGVATLTRPEGMGYLLLVWGILSLAPAFLGTQWTKQRVLSSLSVITVLWLMVMFPYMHAIHDRTGHWHWSGKVGHTLRWGESVGKERPNVFIEQMITETRDDELPEGLLEYLIARPGDMAWRAVVNGHLMDKYVLPGLLQSGGIALVLLGLVHLRLRPQPGPPEWVLAAALLPLAGLLFFVVETRYFLPLIPVLSIIAGIGLARVGNGGDSQVPQRYPQASTILLVIVLLSFVPWVIRPWFRQDPAAVEKAAGLWLHRSETPGSVFIGRYPRIGYYAKSRFIPYGQRSLEDLLAEGRQYGASFLIADNVSLPAFRPDLITLAAGKPDSRDLEIVHLEEDPGGRQVLIYRIKPNEEAPQKSGENRRLENMSSPNDA